MLTVTRTSRHASDVAAELRALVGVEQPKILAQSLTFTAQRAQKAIVEEMPRVFEGGATAYTKNATRIEPATVGDLAARVAVKDRTTNNGTLPEDYLFPSVFGGARKVKRFERHLRYAGVMQAREFAMLGEEAQVDQYGNLKRGEIQRILTATRSAFDPYQNRSDSRRSKANSKKNAYFAGRIKGAGKGRWGVWKRDGADVRPVLIFTTKAPQYRQRLDFEGLARRTAEREFPATFNRLLLKAAGR